MNNIDAILDSFTDKLFEINESVKDGGLEDMKVEKNLMASATTAVLKAVAQTRNVNVHRDTKQLQNLWMDAYAKSDEGYIKGFPTELRKGVQNGQNFQCQHIDENASMHKLNDLEHVCLDLQENLNNSQKNRRMRFGYMF